MDRRESRIEERLAKRGGAVELLRVPACLYHVLTRARNALYDRDLLRITRLVVPVISVGNLTAGGTGKTPFVRWLTTELLRRGLRPGILSRGFGARDPKTGRSDEVSMLRKHFPGVPCVEDANRSRGGRALEELGVDAVLLDDGYQHRRLRRDVDLCLVDATRPGGLPGHGNSPPVCALLPRGLMREPWRGIARANAIVLTRVDQVPRVDLDALEERFHRLAPGVPILECTHRPRELVDTAGRQLGLEALRGRDVDLVSGIGNPGGFETTVRSLGARVATHRRFPDHHAYRAEDLEGLGGSGRWIVTTEKDASKLPVLDLPVVVLGIELEVVRGLPVMNALLDSLPAAPATSRRRALHEGLHG